MSAANVSIPNPATESSGPAAAELLARLRAGEDAAFELLTESMAPRLLAVARRMLRNEEDSSDAVQEAFLSAFKALPRFDGRSSLSTWLHRITMNACLMKLRSKRRRPETQMDELLPQFLEDGHQKDPARQWKPSGSRGIEGDEVKSLVRSKIEELPDSYREVLLLRDIEELDTEETAEVLGVTVSVVKTRLHRARQALRTLLDPYFAEGLP